MTTIIHREKPRPPEPLKAADATLRDYFAAHACIGMLLAKNELALQAHIESIAKASYSVADAMLSERTSREG